DIIDDIATDFRLNVVHHPRVERPRAGEESDMRSAAKTLLDLCSDLQKPLDDFEGRAPLTARVSKHEPYI
ncbi:MAG: hypothetical protein WBM11_18590, partial [Terriglobales bacterium]